MQKINTHVLEYDEKNHSILVSFSYDDVTLNEGEEKILSFDLANWPDKSIDEILNEISKQGYEIMAREVNKKNVDENVKKSIYDKIGKVHSIDAEELNNLYEVNKVQSSSLKVL